MKGKSTESKFSVAILAGGESRRMQRNKALEMLVGKPLISHIIDPLRLTTNEMFIVAKETAGYEKFGLPVCVDRYNFHASIVGIHAAIAFSRQSRCLVVACDMPFAEPALADLLASFPQGYDAVVPLSRRGREPLLALYSKSCLPGIQARIEKGDLSIQRLIDALRTRYVETDEIAGHCDPFQAFTNVNSDTELKVARALYPKVIKRRQRQGSAGLRYGARPLVCFVGKKNSGKTTFLEKLVQELKFRGLRTAYLKHDSHGFEMDREGTDTWRIARAGAHSVAITSPVASASLETALRERSLEELASRIDGPVDIILAEGFKWSTADKLEISRSERSCSLACGEEELLAVISDRHDAAAAVPVFNLDDVSGVADFLLHRYGLNFAMRGNHVGVQQEN